jgi:hypothetical protein
MGRSCYGRVSILTVPADRGQLRAARRSRSRRRVAGRENLTGHPGDPVCSPSPTVDILLARQGGQRAAWPAGAESRDNEVTEPSPVRPCNGSAAGERPSNAALGAGRNSPGIAGHPHECDPLGSASRHVSRVGHSSRRHPSTDRPPHPTASRRRHGGRDGAPARSGASCARHRSVLRSREAGNRHPLEHVDGCVPWDRSLH